MSIYSKLNSLLTAANNKTGESDTTLTDAVQTLIDGYGQGGGGLKYKTGSFTLESDARFVETAGSGIAHSLGEVPKCVIVWQTTYTDSNIPTAQVNAGYVFFDRIMDMDERLSTSAKSADSFYAVFSIAANSTVGMQFASPTAASYMPDTDPTSTEIYLYDYGANNRWRAGVTYHYFVSEAWWT